MDRSCDLMEQEFWKKCSSCKKSIGYNVVFWTCNVSTCNRKRTALQFCSVACWDAHIPIFRHRDSWAEEHRSPTIETWRKVLNGEIEWPIREKQEPEEKVEEKKRVETPKVIRRRPGN
jgi:hypothetical protein